MKYLLLFCAVAFATFGYSQNLYPYIKGGKWGLCDEKKTVVLQPLYDEAYPFKYGLCFVKKGKLWGALNSKGKLVIPAYYKKLKWGFNNYVVADSIKVSLYESSTTNKIALFDSLGKRIYKAKFNELPAPMDGENDTEKYHTYCDKGKWGIMDLNYKILVPAKYESQFWFNGDWAVVTSMEKEGVIDFKGNIIIPFKYDRMKGFDQWGHAIAKLNGKFGVIDKKGNVVIDFKYDDMNSCWNTGYFTPKIGSKIGLLDRQGKELIACSLSYPVFIFNYGLNYRQPEGSKKYGYVDTTGKYAIEAQYDVARSFHIGKALVKKDNKWFYINNRNEKISPEYDEVYTNCFSDTLYTLFKKDGNWGVADPMGKELFTLPGVEKLFSFCDTYEYLSAKKDGKYGVVNLKGEWVIKPESTEEIQYVDGLFLYARGEQTDEENEYGEKIWKTVEVYYILPNGTALRD